MTPHHVSLGQEITLITNTPHGLEVFTTPIVTFEKTPNRQKIFVAPTCFQILSQIELVEELGAKLVEET